MNISLPTGKVISISVYEYLFVLKDEDMHDFYQEQIAADEGLYIENPFSNSTSKTIEIIEEEI